MLVDSHCHLEFPDFGNEQADLVYRANANGVGCMVSICTRVGRFADVLAVAERFPMVYCSVGTHPHNAVEERDITVDHLIALTAHPKVVAIGEAGLDFHYERESAEDQDAVFRTHIAAARQTGLPLVIHARDADDAMGQILREEMQNGQFNAVLHCFSSGRALAELGISLGLYVSFSGILTFKSSDKLREIARDLPPDRLLVETDAPYLAPVPHRGHRNEPSHVRYTAQALADIRGLSIDELSEITTANFFRLFGKACREGA